MKKLYVVKVEYEFPVLAEHEDEAIDHIEEAEKDLYLPDHATVSPIHIFPDGRAQAVGSWTAEALVYGADEDTSFEDAVEYEKKRRHDEEMAKKQGSLF